MNERKLMVIDIEPRSVNSTERQTVNSTERQREQQTLWTRSNNSFKFNFLQDTETLNQASSSSSSEQKTNQLSFTAQKNSTFAFNFQIDPEEAMDAELSAAKVLKQPQSAELPSTLPHESSSSPNTSSASKKKKKKSGKNKAGDGSTSEPRAAEKQEGEAAELRTEEELQRQLDWCIEQLELGMRSHKASPKQKEEASRALKTLRSSKAPLVKKRQVMRAMAGDYRKKMEEEKSKQFKLIQNETASAQLRAVSEMPKKSSFHRRAGIKATTAESSLSDATSDNNFVFTPSKEEFCFNFLS